MIRVGLRAYATRCCLAALLVSSPARAQPADQAVQDYIDALREAGLPAQGDAAIQASAWSDWAELVSLRWQDAVANENLDLQRDLSDEVRAAINTIDIEAGRHEAISAVRTLGQTATQLSSFDVATDAWLKLQASPQLLPAERIRYAAHAAATYALSEHAQADPLHLYREGQEFARSLAAEFGDLPSVGGQVLSAAAYYSSSAANLALQHSLRQLRSRNGAPGPGDYHRAPLHGPWVASHQSAVEMLADAVTDLQAGARNLRLSESPSSTRLQLLRDQTLLGESASRLALVNQPRIEPGPSYADLAVEQLTQVVEGNWQVDPRMSGSVRIHRANAAQALLQQVLFTQDSAQWRQLLRPILDSKDPIIGPLGDLINGGLGRFHPWSSRYAHDLTPQEAHDLAVLLREVGETLGRWYHPLNGDHEPYAGSWAEVELLFAQAYAHSRAGEKDAAQQIVQRLQEHPLKVNNPQLFEAICRFQRLDEPPQDPRPPRQVQPLPHAHAGPIAVSAPANEDTDGPSWATPAWIMFASLAALTLGVSFRRWLRPL